MSKEVAKKNKYFAKELDTKAMHLANVYRRSEAELLEVIIQIDNCKIFYKLGFNSLFAYVTERLKLTPAVAYNLIGVARKSKEVPELKEQVLKGNMSVSKARKLTSVINKGNQKVWIESALSKGSRALEREIALASPQTAVPERVQYISQEKEKHESVKIKPQLARIQLQIGVSEKIMLKLRRAQDLESQKNRQNKGLEETLEALLDVYLEKRDPLKKAIRQKNRGKLISKKNTIEDKKSVKNYTAPKKKLVTDKLGRQIPAKTIHKVQLRDQSRCTYVDSSGARCCSRRYLEVHHIKQYSRGGRHDLDNLTLLCHGHHRVLHSNEKDTLT